MQNNNKNWLGAFFKINSNLQTNLNIFDSSNDEENKHLFCSRPSHSLDGLGF